MAELLFHFTFERWNTVLISLLPALLNAYILVYVLRKLDRNALTYIFALTIFALTIWQIQDTLMRLSTNEVTADLWIDLLWPMTTLVVPVAVHFALFFTDHRRLAKAPLVLVGLYFPWLLFTLMSNAGLYDHHYVEDATWGWILMQSGNVIGELEMYWLGGLALTIFVLLGGYAYGCREVEVKGIQALLIAVGFAIPIIQGVTTQVLMPYVLDMREVPVTSTFMTFFSLFTVTALRRYRLFRFSPEHSADVIIEQMNDGLCAALEKGDIQYVNPRLEELTGYPRQRLVSKPLSSLFLEAEKVNQQLEHQGRTGDGGPEQVLQLIQKNGQVRPVRVGMSSLRGSRGRLIGFIVLITDVSKVVEAEERLKAKNRELGNFIYRTSHDLRGPLASLMGLTLLTQEEVEAGNSPTEYLQLIERTGQRLDSVLMALRDVGQVINHPVRPEPILWEELLQQVWQELEPKWSQRPVRFRVEVQQQNGFSTDKQLLRTVLHHLLDNSIRYQHPRAEQSFIHVQVLMQGKQVELAVMDNGTGIPEELLPMAGTMFWRGSNGASGNGLGLYIVRQAIERLQGAMEITPHAEGGTEVRIVLEEWNRVSAIPKVESRRKEQPVAAVPSG